MTPSSNIADALWDMADRHGATPAALFPSGGGYDRWNFARLRDEAETLARGLARRGVATGTRVVLMVPPGPEFFALVFALFRVGATPVLIDPGMGVHSLGRCLADARPGAFIGTPRAHVARTILHWPGGETKIIVGSRWISDTVMLDEIRRAGSDYSREIPDKAAILFTSGSTGAPKGAVYTHANFLAQVDALRSIYHIEPGEIDLCTFPLFALFAPALGMTAVVPRMDFTRPGRVDPHAIIHPVNRLGVTNLFGSPALLRRIAPVGVPTPTLRRVISAGAPVPASVIEQVVRMLPRGAQVFTPYGATEALPVCNIGSDEILGETRHATDRGAGVCVGRPAPGVTVRILRISDEPMAAWSEDGVVPPGEVGEIVVTGPVVTRSYFNRPDADDLAKIDRGRWHRMGDLGYIDDTGRLWFCGRKSQRVGSHYTIPCEAVFNTHRHVFRSALVGVDGRPVICVELRRESRSCNRSEVRRELIAIAGRHPHTRHVRDVLFHPSFPVDIRHNAKIGREKLAVWAKEQLR